MPGKAAKILITERRQDILRTLRDAVTDPAHLRQRAAVVLAALAGACNEDIAREVGPGRRQVGRWRRRRATARADLTGLECRETRAELRRAIAATLSDEPRPGAPGKFTPEQVAQVLAVACEPPAKSGRPITHWTGHELADEVVKRGIVAPISTTQVNRDRRAAALQPHKSRYWLTTTAKDPAPFEEPVRAVCDTYRAAPARAERHGAPTACTDEMTGIQARERNAPALPMKAKCCERVEFEYTRHGAVTLISNFEVTTGELVAGTIGPTRPEADFAGHIERTVATDPGVSWIFVMDNLNIHRSETLVRAVASACGIDEPPGRKGGRGVLRSMASRRAFLSDPAHRIRYVYAPKPSSWLNPIEVIFGVVMRKVIRRGSFTSVEDLREKLVNVIGYFNRLFAKPFRWTYTGRPLLAQPAA